MDNQSDAAGITRGQNQLYLIPEDARAGATVIAPLLERLEDNTELGLVVVTADSEAAASLAARLVDAATARGIRIVAATETRRASRVLRKPAPVVVGSVHVLADLLGSSGLKLTSVRSIVLAWIDEAGGAVDAAIETLMSEAPKDAARIVIAGAATPKVEQLVERYARRARRVAPATATATVPASYVVVNEASRLETFRRLIDALDPESAAVVTANADSLEAVATLLRSLGYGRDDDSIRVAAAPDERAAAFTILFDLPDDATLATLSQRETRIIALVTPRQIGALRRLAGDRLAPLTLPEAAARARTRDQAVRDELSVLLSGGGVARELAALEPLLSQYDGIEIAAAALRLLEAERARGKSSGVAAPPAATRIYLNVGEIDDVKPGDLVGAILREAGVSKGDLGRVEIRDRHSTVEVSTAIANTVVSRVTGATIKGRRVLAKVDSGRERPASQRDGEGRGAPRGGEGRGAPRGGEGRGAPRGGEGRGAPRGGPRGAPRGAPRGTPGRGPRGPRRERT